jgi:predicted Rossmann-fold nucleotide-binding protein
MKRLCVFCGSSVGGQEAHADAARRLGAAMARQGIGLVFGAGHIGLMGGG